MIRRRRRKPPARLVFLATDYALSVALVTSWLAVAITVAEWRLEASGLAAVWMTFAAWSSQGFARTLEAWRRDKPCRPISRVEWAFLAGQMLSLVVVFQAVVS